MFTTTTPTSRRRTSRRRAWQTAAAAVAIGALGVGTAAATGHRWAPAPNGVSPWLYSQTWKLTGYYYGQGTTHTDTYTDYYATDWTNAGGSSCNQNVYPIWNNLKVTSVDSGYTANGSVYMETRNTTGAKYRLKILHMKPIYVRVGDIVGTSTVIGKSNGLMNGTVNSGNCHIHLATHVKDSDGTWTGVPTKVCGVLPTDGMSLKGC